MHVLEPRELERRRHRRELKKPQHHRSKKWLFGLILIAALYITVVTIVPLAPLRTDITPINVPQNIIPSLPWPTYGQSAIGAVGFGLLAKHGDQKPLPIASVAKVITALAVLKQQPLYNDKPMPIITITAQDVAIFEQYSAQDQSLIAVAVGEQLSEYQALQALLLPSANNMADTLTRWAFGSTAAYLEFVNPFTKTLGMTNTHIADASGFSPLTVSTATDLVKLAEIAMNHPVIAEIVNQSQADLPVAGTVRNVNRLVGYEGVVGIKTGNTDEAGGCYLFSVKRAIDKSHKVTFVGAVMGAANLSRAIDDALPLINAGIKAFKVTPLVQTSQIVGHIKQVGGASTTIIATKALNELTWSGQQAVVTAINLNPTKSNIGQNEQVGSMTIIVGEQSYQVPLVAAEMLPAHSYVWRLRHANGYL